MASGLLMLLDDIATVLDDVAALTKVATKKTAGILGDDLALNAEQVSGVQASRELPVVWAVAKGSFVNKLILVPSALLLSAVAPWSIEPLMIAGGTFLCFEGCEKLAHAFLDSKTDQQHRKQHVANVADPEVDLVVAEKSKVKGAIRTDFILSAEIIVITLGTVATSAFATQLGVLSMISMVMTVGVYGLVAGIVKLDDVGLHLSKTSTDESGKSGKSKPGLKNQLGRMIVAGTPYLMKFLSIAGTAAMFLVGGGILAHGISPAHHLIEAMKLRLQQIDGVGPVLATIGEMASQAVLGVIVGVCVLAVVQVAKKLKSAGASTN